MGFDIALYNKDNEEIGLHEISEDLHNEIFSSKMLWRSYIQLRKMRDYYLANEEYQDNSLRALIKELNTYKMFIDEEKKEEYQLFINTISNPSVSRIEVAGD